MPQALRKVKHPQVRCCLLTTQLVRVGMVEYSKEPPEITEMSSSMARGREVEAAEGIEGQKHLL